MQLSPVIQAITGLFLIGFIVCFSYKIIRFDYTFGCELCNADDNGVKALKFTNIMKATNLILLTEDDYKRQI